MKNKGLFLALAIILLLPAFSFGQSHEVIVPAYSGPGSLYLNQIIMGDTLANGQRRDTLAVYVLKRDSLYLSNGVINNLNYLLTIRAAYGAGKKPTVYLYPAAGTGLPPGQFVNARGNVVLSNLAISGVFEPGTYVAGDTSFLGGMQGAIFDFAAAGFSVKIDSCILTNTNGNHVRTTSQPKNVIITNSVFANMGFLRRSNLGAGKAIDVRGGSVDTLIVQNCTFVNWQDRIIRHLGATGPIKYLKFDHNTLANGMSYHGILSIGKTSDKVIVTNNLLIDPFGLGNDIDTTRQAEFSDGGEKDDAGKYRMTWLITVPDTVTKYTISNNYYAISDSGQAFYNYYQTVGTPAFPTGAFYTPREGPSLTWFIAKKVADSVNAFKKISVSLNKIPRMMTTMMRWYRTPIANGGGGKTKDTRNFQTTRDDYDRRQLEFFRDTMDCKFPTANVAYTGALGGFPAGDLNWFPDKKAQWQATDVQDYLTSPDQFTLFQNYPNPFNPSTIISFNLKKAGNVELSIYSTLGEKVSSILSKDMPAGFHQVNFDASRLSAGIYFYRLETGSEMQVKKMILVK